MFKRGDESVPERLAAVARKRDVAGLLNLLDSLDDEGWEAARRWYRKARTSLRRSEPGGIFRGFETFVASARVEAVLCAALAPPASAAKWLNWQWMGQSVQLVGPLVVRRGRDWCRDFVVAVDARPSRSDSWGQSQDTYALLRAAVDAHDLPTPTGGPFVEGWMAAMTPPLVWRGSKPAEADVPAVLERLRADPRLDDLVAPALGHPQLGQHAHIATAFAALAEEGRLERRTLVDLYLAGLDSPGRPATQKALAEGLVWLRLRSDEVPGGLARVQQLLATCHGQVTSRLLPLALDLVSTEDDLVELTTTIASRQEKKQRTDLLRAITTPSMSERVPVEGRRTALEILAESTDAALAGRASRALDALGGGAFAAAPAGSTTALGLWDLAPPPHTSLPPGECHEPSGIDEAAEAELRRLATATGWELPEPTRGPLALSLLVRWTHRDGARSVRRRLGKIEVAPYDATAFGVALAAWQAKRLAAAYEPIVPLDNGYLPYASPLAERHLRESMHRAGRIPFLLSTPTHDDVSIDFAVLVERLRHSGRAGFGPLDLLLAILRVGPVDPSRAAELDGLGPVAPDLSAGTTTRVTDAVAYLRDAVASGRLVPAPLTIEQLQSHDWVPVDPDEQPRDEFWEAMLPVPLRDFGVPAGELTARYAFGTQDRTTLRATFPWHPDLRLRPNGLWHGWHDWWQGYGHLESRGLPGPACHDLLLTGYAADRPASRQELVDLTLSWIGAGRYVSDTALAAAWARLRVGKLSLARCSAAWEQVFLAGGLRAAWPVALGTAAMAAELPRKPAGLADLLRMLTQYVAEVPQPARSLPPSITALADAKGGTKSHAEARRLVNAREAT